MCNSKHFLIGLIAVALILGTVTSGLPPPSQAEILKKIFFPQAPLVKKWFQKTVCGFRNPGARFVASEDGTEVCDRTTGNIWEQDPDSANRGAMSQSEAIEFCATLNKGHGAVYELPSIQQLVSVQDYTESDPVLKPGVFSNILVSEFSEYWSATPWLPSPAHEGWTTVVNFGGASDLSSSSRVLVWCVHSGQIPQPKAFSQAQAVKKWFQKTVCGFRNPGARFVASEDGTEVCDRTTGNIWEQDPDSANRGAMSQSEAIEFCATLDKGHGAVYELPSIQQLNSVLDYTELSQPLTPGVFSNIRPVPYAYWSGTMSKYRPGASYWQGMRAGFMGFSTTDHPGFVWCIRRDKDAHGF